MKYTVVLKNIAALFIFSIAMGFLESSVVIYLRKIYYPGGFSFPLVAIDKATAIVEIWREAATIVMLAAVGYLSGKSLASRFGNFVFCFAVWDIFYYVFLKVFLNWPESLFTWDILFLIPVPWVGPVWSPCLFSVLMILFALVVQFRERNSENLKIKLHEWLWMTVGTILVFVSFIYDYVLFASSIRPMQMNSDEELLKELSKYIPQSFPHALYWPGFILLLYCIIKIYIKDKKNKENLRTSA